MDTGHNFPEVIAYRKMGVRSRTQLTLALRSGESLPASGRNAREGGAHAFLPPDELGAPLT
ncbi:hypothetical protein KCMC57_up00980 [Kitasatospora sp. CMC57]|uniref:Uncharacterized protein n=1 Tax=Kitasatospora sp. CMC57 TaxID=3231513 RepID=A0AB33JR11_9ACTN